MSRIDGKYPRVDYYDRISGVEKQRLQDERLLTGAKAVALPGQNGGVDNTYPVAGIAVGDVLKSVGVLRAEGNKVHLVDVTKDFEITGTNTVTDNSSSNYSGEALVLTYYDLT